MDESPRSLLVLDDDVDFSSALQRALNKRGFPTQVAQNIKQAEDIVSTRVITDAIIDLRIGEESGLKAIARLHEQDPQLRIVVLTAFANIATAVEAIKLGALNYLTKPTSAEEILKSLDMQQGDASISAEEKPMSVKRLEWEHLHKVLYEHDGNISAAARALNMHRRTLQRKLQKYPVKH